VCLADGALTLQAYEGLWDDVIKQFNSHSSPITLIHANATMQHLMSATLLSNTNNSKVVELEEELSTSLRDAVAGREELEIASFSEDEVHTLGAIASRLVVLTASRDMMVWMEEDEGGKQSSAWDIMNALAGRGRLGYKEEEAVSIPAAI
jgi:cohesin complex subunit SA-1/2